jgi:hypothetical protein
MNGRAVEAVLGVGARDPFVDPSWFAADIREQLLSRAPLLAAACAQGECIFRVYLLD